MFYEEMVGVFRFYDAGKSYANRDEFALVISVMWLSPEHVKLHAAHGKLTKSRLLAMFRSLRDRGVVLADVYRANGRTMPYATLVHGGEHESLWRVDLRLI